MINNGKIEVSYNELKQALREVETIIGEGHTTAQKIQKMIKKQEIYQVNCKIVWSIMKEKERELYHKDIEKIMRHMYPNTTDGISHDQESKKHKPKIKELLPRIEKYNNAIKKYIRPALKKLFPQLEEYKNIEKLIEEKGYTIGIPIVSDERIML